MIQRVCPTCGRIGCTDHERKAWEGSTRRKRLPKNWERIRRCILRRDPFCRLRLVCDGAASTQVHHLNGWEDNRDQALAGVCGECHARESSEEGMKARGVTPSAVALDRRGLLSREKL